MGMGMGMQGTPAKKGKKSFSKVSLGNWSSLVNCSSSFSLETRDSELTIQSMGSHSTPATKIQSRSRSHAPPKSNDVSTIPPEALSTSSLDSSFPSSADFLTPSPASPILDMSSPSVSAILAPQRGRDVFDADYDGFSIIRPRERNSAEVEEWENLIRQAEEDNEEGEEDNLFGWKQDVMWSVQGSTASASTVKTRRDEVAQDASNQDEPTIQDRTVYNEILMSMNDETRPSPSSRTRARSSTIKNRQSTPRKPSQEMSTPQLIQSDDGHTTILGRPRTFGVNHQDSPLHNGAQLQDLTDQVVQLSMDVSLNDHPGVDDLSSRHMRRASKIKDRKSTPHKSSSQQAAGNSITEASISDLTSENDLRRDHPHLLSQLLQSSHPTAAVGLSQLLPSTQSDHTVDPSGYTELGDVPVEQSRTALDPMTDIAASPARRLDSMDVDRNDDSAPLTAGVSGTTGYLAPSPVEKTQDISSDGYDPGHIDPASPAGFDWHPRNLNSGSLRCDKHQYTDICSLTRPVYPFVPPVPGVHTTCSVPPVVRINPYALTPASYFASPTSTSNEEHPSAPIYA